MEARLPAAPNPVSPNTVALFKRIRALSPIAGPSSPKRPRFTKAQKGKGKAIDPSVPKRKCGRPRKVSGNKAVFHRRGGLGERIPKSAVEVAQPHLQPIDLLVPDKDFRDYVGSNGHYFARPLGEQVGHLMQEPCDRCYIANAQCHSIRSKSYKCFCCVHMKHACVVRRDDSFVNMVEQVFEPSTSLTASIIRELQAVIDMADELTEPTTSIKRSVLRTHANALHSLSELVEQGMRGIHEGDEETAGEGEDGDGNEDPASD
ncbi:hypothetical protein EDD18DRAFT_1344461 [Armillaria luteobubalina]|uniref:Uncharacterized protein n=1 Tax=Armillaria luteobubalina TaxID=153913 RepID=A0AA39QL24_9AGAR|nr:hypothetical protein EDD18DRAFT_1344461 [Armillaria luteobubalina]